MITIKFTGLDNLNENFAKHPKIVLDAINKALGLSLSAAEMESKKRTPVDTGMLQGSIGGEGGYSFIRGLTAGIGTNVEYAAAVEFSDKMKHRVGQAHYMEQGVEAAMPFVKEKFEDAMKEIGEKLTTI